MNLFLPAIPGCAISQGGLSQGVLSQGMIGCAIPGLFYIPGCARVCYIPGCAISQGVLYPRVCSIPGWGVIGCAISLGVLYPRVCYPKVCYRVCYPRVCYPPGISQVQHFEELCTLMKIIREGLKANDLLL